MGKKRLRPRNLDGMWNSLLKESRKLGLSIKIEREVFFTNFEILNDKKCGDNIYSFILEQFGDMKKKLNNGDEVAMCPKCNNLLLLSGYMISDDDSTFFYTCTSCGSSYQFKGYGFTDIPKKDQLEEMAAPKFIAVHICMG